MTNVAYLEQPGEVVRVRSPGDVIIPVLIGGLQDAQLLVRQSAKGRIMREVSISDRDDFVWYAELFEDLQPTSGDGSRYCT
jgi:hypothetical protein